MPKNKDIFDKRGRDLTHLASESKLDQPLHREKLIDQVIASFDRKRSVLLTGAQGIGKSAVIHGVAHRLAKQSSKAKKRRLIELSTGEALSGTKYLGEWESKAAKVVESAIPSKAVIYYTDIWNLPHTGKSANNPSNLFDFYQPSMNEHGLLLIGEVSPENLIKAQNTAGFLEMFDIIPVDSLNDSEVRDIVKERASELRLSLNNESLKRTIDVCKQFLSTNDGPGQSLRLLDRIKHYENEKRSLGEAEAITPEFVDKVFSIYSGLPLFVVNDRQTLKVSEIRKWFRERVIGQEVAIESIVESIVMFKAAINDPAKPLGAFLFVGPTGVGKTELAKALAIFLFGSERRLLRFDMSEFSDYNSFQMLVGDPSKPNVPARLTDPVQQQPFQVVLFDELEKGHTNIRDLLLQILDEGRLSDASGKVASFKNTFVIVTSNVGAREASRQSIGFGDGNNDIQNNEKLREGLEAFFRPEFLNRFQDIVPFHPLRREHVERIVRKEIRLVLGRRGISARNIAVDLTDAIIERVSEQGYDVRYGARALKREIERQVVMPIATILAEQDLPPGSILKVDAKVQSSGKTSSSSSTSVRVLNTEQSNAHKRAHQAIKDDDGSIIDRPAVLSRLKQSRRQIKAIRAVLDESGFAAKLQSLELQRQDPELWASIDTANSVISELDMLRSVSQRIETLHDQLTEISEPLTDTCSRGTIITTNKRLQRFNTQIQTAHRELVVIAYDTPHDVIVEISPIGGAYATQRNALFELYQTWAQWRNYTMQMLHEPMEDSESIMFSLEGAYCNGYLKRESGTHRFRRQGSSAAAIRVRVTPWLAIRCQAEFESRTALKQTGQLGGRIKSRTVVKSPSRFVLQNENTLERNREFATSYVQSWFERVADVDENIRRYDEDPFLVKDHLTEQKFNRRDCLKPDVFHELLCQRVDVSA